MSPALSMALFSVFKRQICIDRLPVDFRRLHFLLALQLKAKLKPFHCNGQCTANIFGGVISGAGRAKYCMNYQSGGRQVGVRALLKRLGWLDITLETYF